jgi:hypothetical protein
MKKNIIIPLLFLLLSGNFIQAQDFLKQSENSVVYSNIIKSCPLYPYSVNSEINTLGRVVDIEFITSNSECTEE